MTLKSFSNYIKQVTQDSLEGGSGSRKYLIHKIDESKAEELLSRVFPDGSPLSNFKNNFEKIKGLLKKSLGVPRNKMPVIRQKDISSFILFLKERGYKADFQMISADKLKPIQKEIHLDKVLNNIKKFGLVTSDSRLLKTVLITSKKNFLIDGHHRWAATFFSNPSRKMKVLHASVTVKKLLEEANIFATTTDSKIRS